MPSMTGVKNTFVNGWKSVKNFPKTAKKVSGYVGQQRKAFVKGSRFKTYIATSRDIKMAKSRFYEKIGFKKTAKRLKDRASGDSARLNKAGSAGTPVKFSIGAAIKGPLNHVVDYFYMLGDVLSLPKLIYNKLFSKKSKDVSKLLA